LRAKGNFWRHQVFNFVRFIFGLKLHIVVQKFFHVARGHKGVKKSLQGRHVGAIEVAGRQRNSELLRLLEVLVLHDLGLSDLSDFALQERLSFHHASKQGVALII
jgi:hypothetical protein